MTVYKHFAEIYARGQYPTRSTAIAELLPTLIQEYQISPDNTNKLLDIACGEGSFAVEMAKREWDVTGVDQSQEMLRLAEHNARQAGVKTRFLHQDMRYLDFHNEFDLATCWFDSLNYLVTNDDLQSTFNNVARALKPNGWFLFDMNTIYGLAVKWQKSHCSIEQETPDLMEIHRTSYDFEKHLACMLITWFVRIGEVWQKYEEKHTVRAFSIQDIESCLKYAGLVVVEKLGSIDPMLPLTASSSRVWFLVRK